uniref:Peroxiredoxin-5 n=1 Tax=Laternula elliptica TaxID=228457 RepID=B3VDE6_LATEL|nr:peroxiredoxin V [Laternula elliptica]
MPIKVGDKLPDVTLFENKPDESVKTSELFGKDKHVLVGIVGAFTGTCQNDHFPTFVDNIDKIKAKGVEIVACVSVNDPFVTAAFGTAMNADGKIRMLADTCGTFTEKIDLEWDVAAAFGTKRSQRYVMVINDGVVTGLNVEEDSSKVKCTSGTDILSLL